MGSLSRRVCPCAFNRRSLRFLLVAVDVDVICSVHNFRDGSTEGTLRLELPEGWTSDPPIASYSFQKQNEEADLLFHIVPPSNLGGCGIPHSGRG